MFHKMSQKSIEIDCFHLNRPLLSRDELAGEEHPGGDLRAHDLGKEVGAAHAGVQVQAHEGHAQLSLGLGDPGLSSRGAVKFRSNL